MAQPGCETILMTPLAVIAQYRGVSDR